jgi:hypothetical protein
LPSGLSFTDNGNGSATIAGVPAKTGLYHLDVTARFGKGRAKNIVTQAFSLTVDPG